jgi:hypothetical protein
LLHKDAQDNVGSIGSDGQKHTVGEYCPLSWTLVLMDQVIISWSTVWTALPLVCGKTVLIIQHNNLYHSTSTTGSFLWADYQIFCTEMERMTGIDCQKGNFLANQLSRPEKVLSKKERK